MIELAFYVSGFTAGALVGAFALWRWRRVRLLIVTRSGVDEYFYRAGDEIKFCIEGDGHTTNERER